MFTNRIGKISWLIVAMLVAPAAFADVVTDWNETAWRLTGAMPPPVHGRIVSAMYAAVFDAVNSLEHRYAAYAIDVQAPIGTSADASAASAAPQLFGNDARG